MAETEEFKQFTIAHQLKRRIRIIAPSLYRDKERAHILQILLCVRSEVEGYEVLLGNAAGVAITTIKLRTFAIMEGG